MFYTVERIRTHKGEPTAYDVIFKGQRAYVEDVALGLPLILRFEENSLVTSAVEVFNADWRNESFLTVQTKNSVYVLRKVPK